MKYCLKKQDDMAERLDIFLTSQMPDKSRSFVQNCIKSGRVKVNKKVIHKNSFSLKQQDIVEIDEIEEEISKDIKPRKMDLNIVFEDKDLIVVDKESGICVHPARGNWDNTLVNGLLYKFRSFKKVGKSIRFGLINRIDKDTSGLVLVARNDQALWYFSRLFEEREVGKYYLAVVNGDAREAFKSKRKVVVSNYLARHPKYRKKMAICDKKKGKIATTVFYHLDTAKRKDKVVSLLLACPKTGRTHQIRVHLLSLGLPLLGDKLYSKQTYKRLMLHSYSLKIPMMDGKLRIFKADIPNEFLEMPFKWQEIKEKLTKYID